MCSKWSEPTNRNSGVAAVLRSMTMMPLTSPSSRFPGEIGAQWQTERLLNPPHAEQRMNASREWRANAAYRKRIRPLERNHHPLAERRVDPRHPLHRTTSVVRSGGGLRRWRLVLAAATRSSVRRGCTATRRECATNRRRFQQSVFDA